MDTTIVRAWFARTGVQTGLLVFLLIGLIFVGVRLADSDGEARAEKWLGKLKAYDSVPESNFMNQSELPVGVRERLIGQLGEIKNREAYHADVMRFFYVRYYMAITMFTLLGAMSAILLFFISKKGWAAADDRLIALFIVASAAAACYGALPAVFKQEDNINDNKNLFLQYKGLENEVTSFFVTKEDMTGIIKEANAFIHHVDQQMSKLNNLAIGFDYSKIPTTFIPDVSGNKNTAPPAKKGQ